MFLKKNKTNLFEKIFLFLCVSFLCAGCFLSDSRGRDADEIVIISPHDEDVRRELQIAFEDYTKRKIGRKISIKWQPARGTGNIMRLLINEKKRWEAGGEVGIDVFLGGGAAPHEKAVRMGITTPIKLPDFILEGIPEELGGVRLRHKSGFWYGVTLSSFGIIFNKEGLRKRGIPPPVSWKDLASPLFEGLIILADPSESGSARACYEMILQKFGWEEGWKILYRILANAGGITHASSEIGKTVSSGQAVAGMAIDTYGFIQVEKDGEEKVGFVIPEGESAFTPDPVSVIKGTPRKELATLFVEFLLSDDGQKLWLLKAGEPGGPRRTSLWHFPVKFQVYQIPEEKKVLHQNIFSMAGGLNYDEKKANERAKVISMLFETAGAQNRQRLKDAWKVIQKRPEGSLQKLFDLPAISEKEAVSLESVLEDPVKSEEIEEKFYLLFKNRLGEIVRNSVK